VKRISFIITILGSMLLSSCIPTNPPIGTNPVFVSYLIKEGEHYSNNNGIVLLTNIQEIRFIAKFDSTAIYTSVNPVNQADINKLYGFSDNNSQHHDNSARIGWRWYNNQLQLHAYIYNSTVRSGQFIKAVGFNTDITCSIRINGDKYIFSVDGTTVEMPRTSVTPSGYKLYPYFGGDEVAPHDIIIQIKDIL
jgi:hypothetical protein